MTDPVVAVLTVTAFGEVATEQVTIDRRRWNQLTPAKRGDLLDELAASMATNLIHWAWVIPAHSDAAGV